MFKFNNSIVPNKVRIGWHYSSNKYAYWDAYSALKSMTGMVPDILGRLFGTQEYDWDGSGHLSQHFVFLH